MHLSKKAFLTVFFIFLPVSFGISLLLDLNSKSPGPPFIILGIIALVATLAVSFCLWFLFAHFIIKPIKHFSEITKNIAAGNFGAKIHYQEDDEFGELANNINITIDNFTRGMQTLANSLKSEIQKEKELTSNYLELEKAKAKDEVLLSSIKEGVVAIDNNSKIILFNQAAVDLTGYREEEALGNNYYSILSFESEKKGEQVPDFIGVALTGKESSDLIHIVIITKTGQKIPVSQDVAPIKSKDKQTYGAIIVLRNITKERQLTRLKDEFVSIASHELRTPMSAIKGLISMVFEGDYGEINENLKEPLADIASSTERLIQLVNDLLDVSRIEGGRVKYFLSDIKINDLIQEIVVLLQPVAFQKGIELRFNQSLGSDEVIRADANKVKQILSNLIGNSLKFTDKGFIEIKHSVQGESLHIFVKDTGTGIKPEDQKKLFNKFQQITSAQYGRPVGTGLGLYISKKFAMYMGGDLWLTDSVFGEGSVFTLSVPLANTELAKRVTSYIMEESGN